ncbi:MAG: hypothetical protein K0S34_854 [Bacillales bacterium]|jgi:predicted RNA-binding protein|nr:hypothetical protein [Bacillales bacterium]
MTAISCGIFVDFKNGFLSSLTNLVKSDSTLNMEFRCKTKSINIYYRGGNILRVTKSINDTYNIYFDRNYLANHEYIEGLPKKVRSSEDISEWINSFPILKDSMDKFFTKTQKNERLFQQMVVYDNNVSNIARSTDYYICDTEFVINDTQFDIIGVRWPSSSVERKNNEKLKLAIIEMKYGDDAITGDSGIVDHFSKFTKIADELPRIARSAECNFNCKLELGLIDCGKSIKSIMSDNPDYILLLANHDPQKTNLKNELIKLKQLNNERFDVKIATASCMGYGLYQENMIDLDTFIQKI